MLMSFIPKKKKNAAVIAQTRIQEDLWVQCPVRVRLKPRLIAAEPAESGSLEGN